MIKSSKKIFSIILTLVLVTSVLSPNALAANILDTQDCFVDNKTESASTDKDTKQDTTSTKSTLTINTGSDYTHLTFYSSAAFTLTKGSTLVFDGSLQYLLGDASSSDWQDWTGSGVESSIDAALSGDKYYVHLRGINNTYVKSTELETGIRSTTGPDIYCEGNIETLLDYNTVKNGDHPTMAEEAFKYLFGNFNTLISPPALPATNLTKNCYMSMFRKCTKLASLPDLPATTVTYGCYRGMFAQCKAITSVPIFKATNTDISCYAEMFRGCEGIPSVDKNCLPATTLHDSCYYGMFAECYNLTNTPDLPATTLADSCYIVMFSSCYKLQKAPVLPATVVPEKAYRSMFYYCQSLTKPPEIDATTITGDEACYEMFSACYSLLYPPQFNITSITGNKVFYRAFRDCRALSIYTEKVDGDPEYTTPWKIAVAGGEQWNYDMFVGCKASVNLQADVTYYVLSILKEIRATAVGFDGDYDGAEHSGVVTVTKPTENYTIKYATSEEGEYKDSNYSYVKVGTYTVYYIVYSEGYNDLKGSFTINIKPLEIVATAIGVDTDYNGENHNGVVTVTKPTEDIYLVEYSLDNENFRVDNYIYSNPGEYTVYYRVTAPNYSEFKSSFTINIRKINMDVTANGYEGVVDGKPHSGEVIVNSPKSGVKIMYSLDKDEYSSDKPEFTNAGENEVFFIVTAPFYNDYEGSFTVILTGKNVVDSVPIYIMYNKNSGEHLFTSSLGEYNKLEKVGWKKENVAFYAYKVPVVDGAPIYRVYNPNAKGGDHHYTKSLGEANKLVKNLGWKWDNGGRPVFYAKGDVTVYKLYNKCNGRHHYTRKQGEYNKLSKAGWVAEGIAWYATIEGDSAEPLDE